MKPLLALRAGATLMALIGLSRVLGGIILFRDAASPIDSQPVSPDLARPLGVGLVLVGIVALVAATGLFRKRRWAWPASLAALVLFPIASVVNGYVVFGHPPLLRTAGNFLAAIFVLGVIALGRSALQGRAGTVAAGK